MSSQTPPKKQAITSTSSNIHFETVRNKIPTWLINASSQTHQALRKANLQAPDWFEKARLAMPDVAQQLQRVYTTHLIDEQYVNQVLANLPSAEVFAAPLLTTAIKDRFGLTVDVKSTYLFNPRRVMVDQSFAAASRDPLVANQNALKAATQPLLQAALQNFEAWEAEPGGMDKSSHQKAVIYATYPIQGVVVKGDALPIPPEQFAGLCRELDLGGKYQALITRVLSPTSRPGDAPDAAESNLRGQFKLFEASAFTLQVHIARMKNVISVGLQSALLELARNKSVVALNGQPLACNFLRLWDIQLTGIVAIASNLESSQRIEKVTVYIPDDPYHPIKEYDSTLHFIQELRDRLLQPGYQDFFQRFVPARHRSLISKKLNEVFYPKVWNAGGWYEQKLDKDAKLHLRAEAFSGPLLSGLYQQKTAVLRDDGLFHAVPTAAEDHKTLEDKLRYFAETTLQVLNVAAFVVPVLGEVMLAVTAAQLCYEAYEGIESLAKGEKEQAWGYLLDVLENVALMAALGAASSGSGGIAALKAPPLIEQMRAVELPAGGTRLWKPDLAPFAHDIVLPAGLKPNALGLYEYQGQQWLPLDGSTYAVKGAAPWRLQHPSRPDAYAPQLRHNNAGAWLHELDQPLDWQGLTLFRRLGQASAQFSDISARRILQVSDTHEAVLRRVLTHGERPPALLEDTMQRFQLDQELDTQITGDEDVRQQRNALFQARYQALQASEAADVVLLRRVYPELPRSVAQEVQNHASPLELQQLALEQRVPLRLAEEIRAYQQQIRLTRAYEGLYLDSVANPDTDKLLLHTLETLPGWSPQVRLEVRDGSFYGPLIDSIGPTDAPIRKVLIKDAEAYQTRDADDQHLHGRNDIYAAVMHALPDAQRQALGLPHVGQGAELKSLLQSQPLLPRQTLTEVLKMQPRKPGSQSPMRLADGRLGYLLSGRGVLAGDIARETLLDKVRALELAESPESTLNALENTGMGRAEINRRLDHLLIEQQTLRASLDSWTPATTTSAEDNAIQMQSREHINDELWHHWQASNLPEIGRASGRLQLRSVCLSDFPAQLPDFFYERVQTLELTDTTVDTRRTPDEGQALGQLFSRLPHMTSLTLARSALPAGFRELELFDYDGVRQLRLTFSFRESLASRLTGLRELRLTNQGLYLSSLDITNFRQLEHLRILDLSGNRLPTGTFPVSSDTWLPDFSGLNLQYLGLERVGLSEWPAWINSDSTAQIAEISLANNRISGLPDAILYGESTAGLHTRISLQGNALSRGAIIGARLSYEAPRARFSFDVDVPQPLETNVNELLRQQRELREAVDNWAEASSSTAPLNDGQVQARRQIGETLGTFWRDICADRGLKLLELNAIDIGDFPQRLPEFFYRRVQYLELDKVTATPEHLDRLLRNFTQLNDLTLRGHVTPLAHLPVALVELPALATLRLLDQGLLIDQAAIEFFARIPALDHLELNGNSLGTITDVSSLAARRLRWLGLNNVGLQSWPAWLDELIPRGMEILNLDDNQITELPEHILQNPRNDNQHTEIGLTGNPLSHDTLRRAHISEADWRSYSFAIDLPNDILVLDYDIHSSDPEFSDNEGSDSDGHIHSPRRLPAQEGADIEPWLGGSVEEDGNYRGVWQQLENSGDAQDLLNLVGRLRHTADYRTQRSRPELVTRVWRVLEAAAQNTELRLTLNGMSEEPLRLLMESDTCPDGIRLEFNQMEVMIYTRQALLDAPTEQRGQALYQLTRRLYRLEELDRIAREQAGSRDEAEVRLAYRLQWATELDLPLPPNNMLYRAHARLRPGELDEALGQVKQGENGEPFMTYAAQRDFWVDYLRETYAERFRQLKEAYEAQVTALIDLHPDDNIEQYAPQITVLEQQFKRDEQNLIRELTNQEGMSQD